MPGFVLDAGATALCAHGGKASPSLSMPRVKVMGKPVVTQPPPYLVTGCPFTVGTSPMPCVSASWLTASVRVRVQGQPLLLTTSRALTAPNGVPLNLVPGQTRVKAT